MPEDWLGHGTDLCFHTITHDIKLKKEPDVFMH